jgi:hypothetical protein
MGWVMTLSTSGTGRATDEKNRRRAKLSQAPRPPCSHAIITHPPSEWCWFDPVLNASRGAATTR